MLPNPSIGQSYFFGIFSFSPKIQFYLTIAPQLNVHFRDFFRGSALLVRPTLLASIIIFDCPLLY